MSKRKSYMNRDNILSESFFTTFLKAVLPKSVQKSIIDKYVKRVKQDIKKTEDDLKKSYAKTDKLYNDARKYFKTQGIDMPPSDDKRANKEFWDKIMKAIK